MNAPFLSQHEKKGRGLTSFAYKAIEEGRKGKKIALVVPVNRIVTQMLEAGAEVRSVGRVRWRHIHTGEPMPAPTPCVLFVLRPA